jgi:capsular polysaccharide biosynthesis protein
VEPLIEPQRTVRRTPRIGRLTVLESLRRHFLLALLPVVLLLAVAFALAMTRDPEYTSEARLNVGGLSLTQQSIEGYSHAVQQLAIAYARSIQAPGVVGPAARETRIPPSELTGSLSATPIQGSPIIAIRGTSEDEQEAVRIANAGADALVDYAVKLNSGRTISDDLLQRYRSAAEDYRSARIDLARAPARGPRRERIETRLDTAKLKRDTVGFLYSQSQAGQATVNLVQKLAPATTATSDRDEVLQDYLAAALVAGLLIGVGMAVARANSVTRRRLGES